MSPTDDLARLVEFKVLLCRMAEDYLFESLHRTAKTEGHRLPPTTRSMLRTGALAAVSALRPHEVAVFATSQSWQESIRRAVASGAWARLLERTVLLAFPLGSA